MSMVAFGPEIFGSLDPSGGISRVLGFQVSGALGLWFSRAYGLGIIVRDGS